MNNYVFNQNVTGDIRVREKLSQVSGVSAFLSTSITQVFRIVIDAVISVVAMAAVINTVLALYTSYLIPVVAEERVRTILSLFM